MITDEIAAESENTKIILHHVDLSSFQSVREFCARVIETEPKIDILIHNAGFAAFLRRDISTDGIDYTMATNHYGPFLMTILLMDLMKKSAPSRIVNVGSKAHTLSFLDPEDPFSLNPVGCWPISFFNYSNSKMATLLTSSEMARQLHGTGVTVNTLHPGAIDTEIWRNYPFLLRIPIYLIRMFLKNLTEGIQTTLYVALSTNLANVSGAYFRNCNLGKPHKNAENVEWQKFMFDESVKIIKLANIDHFV